MYWQPVWGKEKATCSLPHLYNERCGGKIRFSPPPPISVAEDWPTPGLRRDRHDGDGQGDGRIQGYRGGGDGQSNRGYIFGRPRGRKLASHLVSHIISSHCTTNYTLYSYNLFISLTLSETPCGSGQLHGSSQPGSIISPHPLARLFEPEPLFLTNSFWNAVRGVAECCHCAFYPLAPLFHHKWCPNADSGLESWVQNGGKVPY